MSRTLALYHVDAFARDVFKGNPAGVVPLGDRWLATDEMQAIATENGLPETAFIRHDGDSYHIRWFSPTQEVELCGHATLAAAHIVLEVLRPSSDLVRFESRSGLLAISKRDGHLVMALPAIPGVSCEPPEKLVHGIGKTPVHTFATKVNANYYAIFKDEDEVAAVQPDLKLLEELHPYGIVVSAVGRSADFVSRHFAPSYGIPEDSVTGSTHCTLVPYWAGMLGKRRLRALQLSKRGGELLCDLKQDHVEIGGHATTYMAGQIYF